MTPERVVVIDDMSTSRGGSTALALLSARLLRARGVEVIYVTGDTGNADALTHAGVQVFATNRGRLLEQGRIRGLMTGAYDKRIVALLDRVIARFDGPRTVYHVHGWAQTLSPAVFKPLIPVASRSFVHCHDFFMACPNSVFFDFQSGQDCTLKPLGRACVLRNCDKRSYPQKLWRVGRQAILRRLYHQDLPWAGMFMIHPGMRDNLTLAGYAPERLITLRNPAAGFSATRIAAETNRKFAFVGRVEPDKGVDTFVSAGTRADVEMVVIGDGPMRERLAASYPDVHFTGWVEPGGIGEYLRDCRALVMPSRFREPFGLVAVEASLAGLPVILPHTALLAPEIRAAGLGAVYDPRDPVGLADAMAQMRDADAPTIHTISKAGFDGAAGLGQSQQDWIDRLIEHYGHALMNTGYG